MNKSSAKYYEAVGRRKTAIARVRLMTDGQKHFLINTLPLEKYFPSEEARLISRRVLALMPEGKELSVSAKISGGGSHAQAEALAHGLARAALLITPELKTTLRQGHHLTRDARMKERRKFGLKKARKAPQWSKR